MSCAVCGRASRGYGFTSRIGTAKHPRQPACSLLCLDTLYRKDGRVFDLHHWENQGLDAASDAAGEYLDKLGKTDFATMTGEEWRGLLQIVFVRSTGTIQRLATEGAAPF